MKLLSVMAAIRLDDEVDNIETTLSSALLDTKNNAAITDRSITTVDPLASSTWEEVDYYLLPNSFLVHYTISSFECCYHR